MKIPFKFFSYLLVLTLIVSCNNDDNGDGDETAAPALNLDVIGIWDLVAINVSAPQDIDLDGTPSSNLLDEMPCISGTLLIDADFTWTFEQSEVEIIGITGGLFSALCSGTDSASGTWSADDTEVTFQGSSLIESFGIVGETLVNDVDEDLPGVQSFVYERRP